MVKSLVYDENVSGNLLPEVRSEKLHRLVEDCGAVLRGHFRLASLRHSDIYVEKFRILERPPILMAVAQPIADHFRAMQPDVIAGPSTGGMLVAYEVARQLAVPAVYIESENSTRVLRRGASIARHSRVLVVDDVLTTGISLKEVLPVIQRAEAIIVGIGVLIDRSEHPVEFGAEAFASLRYDAKTYSEDELPAWLAAIPVTTPGTRAKSFA